MLRSPLHKIVEVSKNMHCHFPQTGWFTQMISDHSGSSECLSYTYFLLFVSLLLVFDFVFVFVRKFVFAVCLCRAHLTDYPGSEYDTNTYFVKTQIHDFLMIMTMSLGKMMSCPIRLVRTLCSIYKIFTKYACIPGMDAPPRGEGGGSPPHPALWGGGVPRPVKMIKTAGAK